MECWRHELFSQERKTEKAPRKRDGIPYPPRIDNSGGTGGKYMDNDILIFVLTENHVVRSDENII